MPEAPGHETSREAHLKCPDFSAARAGLASIGTISRVSSGPHQPQILGSAADEQPFRCIRTK
jgi:hypothetical protein